MVRVDIQLDEVYRKYQEERALVKLAEECEFPVRAHIATLDMTFGDYCDFISIFKRII